MLTPTLAVKQLKTLTRDWLAGPRTNPHTVLSKISLIVDEVSDAMIDLLDQPQALRDQPDALPRDDSSPDDQSIELTYPGARLTLNSAQVKHIVNLAARTTGKDIFGMLEDMKPPDQGRAPCGHKYCPRTRCCYQPEPISLTLWGSGD